MAPDGRRCVFDVEGDGLLYAQGDKKQVTQVWCLAAADLDTGEEFYWGVDKQNVEEGVAFLAGCSLLIGHNAIGYDYPALERLYPWFKRPAMAWDSMVLAKCIWPMEALVEPDMRRIRMGIMPGNLLKRHSLEAWGYRTGTNKTHYKGGFEAWNQPMADYLMDDIRATLALWRMIEGKGWPEATFQFECDAARIVQEQWEEGVNFDMDRAMQLASELRNTQAGIETQLVELFGSWWEPMDDHEAGYAALTTTHRKMVGLPDITLPRYGKTGKRLKDYVGPPIEECCKGDRYVRIKRVTFEPSNRHHLGLRLQDVYGWKPKAFGRNGAPTVDEGTLEAIPDSVLPPDIRQLILDYFVTTKTMAMLCTGRNNWIKMAGQWGDGRVHGEMDTVGAITRRASHKNPNLGQVPSVTQEKGADGKEHVVRGIRGGYGWECRELFISDAEGWELTGVDASSLELILLGHYLTPHDGGAFSQRVCDPTIDAHRANADATGLTRQDVKTAIYLKVYGGSAYKLSLGISIADEEVAGNLRYRGLSALLRSLEKRFGPEFVSKLDDRQRAKIAKARQIILKLEAGITGLTVLIDAVQGAAERGWIKGIDGSRITIRKPYAALNSLLQSAGAISCKVWMVLVHQELERRGLRKGVDWKQVLWVHDELQITHRAGLAPVIKEVAEACMVRAGEALGLRGRFRTEGKTGRNWAECH